MSILDKTAHYREIHQEYLNYNEQLLPQRQWMSEKLGPRLLEIFERKKDIRVLAVGSGTGEVDVDFLNEIVKRGNEACGKKYSVVYQVVDINPDSLDFFKSVVTKDENYSRITFQWDVSYFDAFCDKLKDNKENGNNSFDFAHFVRSMYYMESSTTMSRVYDDVLAKDGILAIVGENKDAFWPKMMQFSADHEIKHEVFASNGPSSDSYFLPGWLRIATEKGWKHESHTGKYGFDVTPALQDDSKHGGYLLDFFFHDKDVLNTLKKSVLDDFLEMLRKNCRDEERERNGVKAPAKIFPCELGAIIVTKE